MTTPTFDPPAERPDARAHTAGPWRTQGWVPTWAYIPVKDARHNVVCSMYPDSGHGYTREEVEANARLIAAAPDLLAALIDAEEEIHHPGSARQAGKDIAEIMRGAIAKATGGARP